MSPKVARSRTGILTTRTGEFPEAPQSNPFSVGSFDSVTTSLREILTPLRMTTYFEGQMAASTTVNLNFLRTVLSQIKADRNKVWNLSQAAEEF
jgi:hypothetical protein